jgi:hypothetical protein
MRLITARPLRASPRSSSSRAKPVPATDHSAAGEEQVRFRRQPPVVRRRDRQRADRRRDSVNGRTPLDAMTTPERRALEECSTARSIFPSPLKSLRLPYRRTPGQDSRRFCRLSGRAYRYRARLHDAQRGRRGTAPPVAS